MNRRQCVLASLVTLMGFWPGAALAQPAGGAPKPAAAPPAAPAAPITLAQVAYTSPATSKAIIDDFVGKNIAVLMNEGDAAGRAKSREVLTVAAAPGGTPGSPEFELEYARSLNTALITRLAAANKPTLQQRLNGAIVVARVAAVAQNAALEPITLQLINDPAEPVVMWALKAAQPQVPQVLATKVGNAPPRLLTAIAPAVFKHPSGPIFDEAYSAVNYNDAMVKDELLKLWSNRLTQYLKDCPDDPDVDGEPVFTLTTSEMWKTVLNNPKAQTDVVQMVSDQLSLATQWADTMPNGEKRDQLAKLITQCAQGFQVVGTHQGKDALRDAAKGPQFGRQGALPTKLMPIVKPLLDEVPKAFAGVKPSPTIGPAAAGAPVVGPAGAAQP